MRFDTQPHQFYCGIDLHARTMYRCMLNQDGELVLHRNMKAAPEPFLQAIAPSREDLVVCVECLFTWYWLADLCTQEGIPVVLGHALYMKAIHGGKAKNDRIDAHQSAVLLRGGMLPQASVSPAELRATRDLRRRRMYCMRQRAALLAHVQKTNRQDNLPEIGKKLAYTGNRDGVAERCADPAVHKSIEVDLALIDSDDRLLSALELALVKTAKPHDANTCYRRQSVPGIGKILALVLLYELHDLQRCPRVQEFVSSGRLVTCAKESAGKRYGPSGTKIGNAYLKGACSEAAVLFLRDNPRGQTYLARWEKKPGTGKALTVLAHQLARAVYDMGKRDTAFDRRTCLHESWSGVGEPVASREHRGLSLGIALCDAGLAASVNASEHGGFLP
jgi:transposase